MPVKFDVEIRVQALRTCSDRFSDGASLGRPTTTAPPKRLGGTKVSGASAAQNFSSSSSSSSSSSIAARSGNSPPPAADRRRIPARPGDTGGLLRRGDGCADGMTRRPDYCPVAARIIGASGLSCWG
ncbi:hypothetical protein NL676_019964 [Syzygium grande]|nr:hypothetical protein NL676_019964 [Syzygium grande]